MKYSSGCETYPRETCLSENLWKAELCAAFQILPLLLLLTLERQRQEVGGWVKQRELTSEQQPDTNSAATEVQQQQQYNAMQGAAACFYNPALTLWQWRQPLGLQACRAGQRGGIRIDHFQVTRLGPLHIRLYRRAPIDWHPDFDHFQVACFTRLTLLPWVPDQNMSCNMRWVGGAAEELHNLDRVGRRDSDINASISPQEPNQFPDGGRADILQVKRWLCMVDTLQDILYIFL